MAPLIDNNGEVFSVFMFRVNPDEIYKKILEKGKIGNSGKSFILTDEGRVIGKSRFLKGSINKSAHNPKLSSTLVADEITRKKSGSNIKGFIDHRGVRVAGAWTWSNQLKFGIASEVDFDEVMKPIIEFKKYIFLGVAIILPIVWVLFIKLINSYKLLALKNLKQSEENKEKDVKIKESEGFFNMTVDYIPGVFYAKDLEGKFLGVNQKFLNLFDKKLNNVISKSNFELFPKDLADEFSKNDKQVAQSKEVRVYEEISVGGDGLERFYDSYKFPYINEEGHVYATGGISFDVTDKKILERKLAHRSRLESLGEMSAGVAHEINNPMTIINMNLKVIKKIMNGKLDKDMVFKAVQEGEDAIARCSKIITGLKTFSRKSVGNKEDYSFTTIIENAIELVEVARKMTNIKIEFNKSPDSTINCRKVEIEQVLINLLQNALYIGEREVNDADRVIKLEMKRKSHTTMIRISDPGNGIDKAVQQKLFDPFFTTKAVGVGTGLGLSISKGIISSHGGDLYYELFEGKTSFVIEIPSVKKVEAT